MVLIHLKTYQSNWIISPKKGENKKCLFIYIYIIYICVKPPTRKHQVRSEIPSCWHQSAPLFPTKTLCHTGHQCGWRRQRLPDTVLKCSLILLASPAKNLRKSVWRFFLFATTFCGLASRYKSLGLNWYDTLKKLWATCWAVLRDDSDVDVHHFRSDFSPH